MSGEHVQILDLSNLTFEEQCEAMSGFVDLFVQNALDESTESMLFETFATYPEVAGYFDSILSTHSVNLAPAQSVEHDWSRLDEELYSYSETEAALWQYMDGELKREQVSTKVPSLSAEELLHFYREQQLLEVGLRRIHQTSDISHNIVQRVMNIIQTTSPESRVIHPVPTHQSVFDRIIDWLAPVTLVGTATAAIAVMIFGFSPQTDSEKPVQFAEPSAQEMTKQGLDKAQQPSVKIAIQNTEDVSVEEIDSEGPLTSIFESEAHHVKIIWIAEPVEVNS